MQQPYVNKRGVGPIALVMSDIHLSHKPPAWRANEIDWYGAMKQVFGELEELTIELQQGTFIPWIVAGDIFHKWNSPPSLINLAMKLFAAHRVLAIPGQHDLPNHMDQQMEASPFNTLVQGDKIRNIDGDCVTIYGGMRNKQVRVKGFGWNAPLENQSENACDIAVVHRYVWMDGCSYHGAPNTNKVGELAESLGRPKLIVTGDNHIGFWHSKSRIFNCGSLMRRNSDQRDYAPRVGIVYSDLSIIPYYLDTTHDRRLDKWAVTLNDDSEDRMDDVQEFLKEMNEIGGGGLDYLDAVRRYAVKYKVKPATTKLIEMILTGE